MIGSKRVALTVHILLSNGWLLWIAKHLSPVVCAVLYIVNMIRSTVPVSSPALARRRWTAALHIACEANSEFDEDVAKKVTSHFDKTLVFNICCRYEHKHEG